MHILITLFNLLYVPLVLIVLFCIGWILFADPVWSLATIGALWVVSLFREQPNRRGRR